MIRLGGFILVGAALVFHALPGASWDLSVLVEEPVAEGDIAQLLKSAATHEAEGEVDYALELFERVLAEDAENLSALIGSGSIHFERLNYADAFQRYDQAVKLDPTLSLVWSQRGIAAFALRDFQTAIASMERAVANRPVNGFLFESLAWAHFSNRSMESAIESARTAVLMYQREGKFSLYPFFIIHFSQLQSGQASQARSTLAYAERNLREQGWPFPVLAYLTQRIDVRTLLANVTSPHEETEAHVYIGMNLLLQSDTPDKALPHLAWASQRGYRGVFEHTVAQTLEKDLLVTGITVPAHP